MNNYELLFIMDSNLTDEDREATIAKFTSIVTDANGTIETIDKWGVKKLAYPIAFRNDGFYCLINFSSDSTVPAEIERVMNITDSIMRHVIIKKS